MSYRTHQAYTIGFKYATGLALLLSLSGCMSWFTGRYQDPEVHLVHVEVVKAKLFEQRFVLRLSIDNPNDSRLPVRGLIYRVTLGGILLTDGEADDWFTVAAHSKEYYEIAVRTNLWEHLRDLAKLLKHPDRPIPYRLEGTLKTGFLFGHHLHLDRSGEIIPGDYIPE
jgi:LEA14-like dessication related protein